MKGKMKVFREETPSEKIKRLSADLSLLELSIILLSIFVGISFVVLGVLTKNHT